MSLLSEWWKWPASIFDSFFLEFISSCWGTYLNISLNLFYATFLHLKAEGWLNPGEETNISVLHPLCNNHSSRSARSLYLSTALLSSTRYTDKIMNNSISGRWWTDRVFIPELYHALLCRTDQSNCAISRNNTNIQLDSLHSLKNAGPFMIRLSNVTCPWLSCTFIIQCFILCWISIIKEMTELMFCHCIHTV